MTTPVNPDATARLAEALRAIVESVSLFEREYGREVVSPNLHNDANNALHMAQLPVNPSKEFIIKSGVVEDENGNRWRLGIGPLFAVVDSLEPLPVVPVSEDVETIRFAITDRHRRIMNIVSRDFTDTNDEDRDKALAALDRLAAAAGRPSDASRCAQ